MTTTPDWMLAAVAGLGSALVLEIVRHVLARVQKTTEKHMDDATSFRHDLLARISALESDIAKISQQRNQWQERYYAERELRTKAQWKLESQNSDQVPPELTPPSTTNLPVYDEPNETSDHAQNFSPSANDSASTEQKTD